MQPSRTCRMDEESRRVLPKTGYPRRRAIAACLTCRERKRKCDNSRPTCSSCQKIGIPCQYGRRDESSFDAPSLRILDQLSVVENLVRDIKASSTLNSSSTPANSSDQSQLHNAQPPQQDGRSSTGNFTAQLNVDTSLHGATDKLLQWPVFNDLLSPLQRFKFVDFRGVETYTYLDDLFNPYDTSEARSLLESPWHSSPLGNISTDRSAIEGLVDQFFDRVNIKNPILNRRTASQYCQQCYESGPVFNLESCLVWLMCALGAISTKFNPHETAQTPQSSAHPQARLTSLRTAHRYFVAAEQCLGAAMSNDSTLAIQCLCLAGIYHMYSLNPVAALRMFRAAASSLQILASTSSASAEGMSQINISLYWMCYKSEREILTEMPISAPTLRESGTLNSYPPPPQASSMDSDEWAASEEDSWYFLLSEIALRRITDQVAEVVTKYIDTKVDSQASLVTDIEDLIPIIAEFERQAEAFRSQLPLAIRFPDVPQEACTEWKQYSRGRYYRVLELMHRPFLFAAIHEPSSCGPAVQRLAEKSLFNALRYLQHSHTSHRHHGIWLQLRNELKEASLLVTASQSAAATSLRLPEGWEAAVAKTLRTFDYWSWEFPPCKSYAKVLLTLINSTSADMSLDVPISCF